MPMKKYKPEQIVTLLQQIEVEIANGKTTAQAYRDAQITAQTFYRWRKEFGGLKLDQAKAHIPSRRQRRSLGLSGHSLSFHLKVPCPKEHMESGLYQNNCPCNVSCYRAIRVQQPGQANLGRDDNGALNEDTKAGGVLPEQGVPFLAAFAEGIDSRYAVKYGSYC